MVHPSVIESKLGGLGFKTSRWFKPEIKELEHILMEDENIVVLACGRYFGSFALLVATDRRLLLIDKRVFFMTVEDTRYDMISEIDYNSQVYSATVTIFTMNKTHKFTSAKYKHQLRELTNYVQRRVMEIRQHSSQVPDIMPNTTTNYIPSPVTPISQSLEKGLDHSFPELAAQSKTPSAQSHDHLSNQASAGRRIMRNHFGHISHMVGSAATKAAHTHTAAPMAQQIPFSPYTQGSLVTRSRAAASNY